MTTPFRFYLMWLLLTGLGGSVLAQTTLTTQSFAPASVCPGTAFDLPFTASGAFGAGNTFSVQLTKGTSQLVLPVSALVTNTATGQYTATASLPASLETGTYQVRVVASNPAVTGSVSPTRLFVKTRPVTAPTLAAQPIGNNTSQYSFCQNDSPLAISDLVGQAPDNYRIQYDFGTGLASTSQRTFTAPVVSTSAVGRATYNVRYAVIDEAKGCNPAEQVGTVSYLVTEVHFRPAAPSPPAGSLTYCQSQTTAPLTIVPAAGVDEIFWYNEAGTRLSTGSLAVSRATPGTATYQVSQSQDRCESAKTSFSVVVKPASEKPTAAKTYIELCRGSSAMPLMATGTNLLWTDPTGVTSTTAPVPSTLNASKTSDGDAYYVSQTGPNGCPSDQLLIRVLVQAQPTLSLGGARNINIGLDTPLQLAFTGTGPYRYRITSSPGSSTLTGTATKDTSILVTPTQSTVYQVAEVSNGCGAGLPGNPATATVTVLVPTIRTLTLQSATACAGNTVTAVFQTSGTFNAGNVFRLQLARTNPDTSKLAYTDLVIRQQVGTTELTGALPATTPAGTYLVRVIATNPKIPIIGTPSATTLTVLGAPTASFTTTTPTILDGESAKLVVTFSGDGPWTFAYRDSTTTLGTPQTITTTTNPYILDLKPRRTTVYQLTSLSNGCSAAASLPGRITVQVSPLLATEPLVGLIQLYPIPATSQLTVQVSPMLLPDGVTLTLFDEQGRTVLQQTTRQPTTVLGLNEQPVGIYIIQMQAGGQRLTRRVLKQ